ncbi:MAG: O-antigen ligase family protein [Parvibaculum sp.]|uniref:O-antigen ligase family protein n=1 Tax=Parvibaculum sp. TaxID=2024848 RepID=UPI003C75CB7D
MDGWFPGEQSNRAAPAKPFSWSERLGDALVFVVVLSSFYQKSTPGVSQPVLFDLVLIVCMGVFFLLGLKFPRGLVWPVAMWGLVLAGYSIGGMSATYIEKVTSVLQVAAYLVCAFIFFASYVFEAPDRRMRLIFNAYAIAAFVAALTGIAGYFGMIADASGFTGYGRASGTFNDPNVFGPYLIAPILYLGLRLSTARSAKALMLVPALGVLVLALLLSFSRGAWGGFLLSAAVFVGLTLATSRSSAQTYRLVAFSAFMGLLIIGIVGVALSTPKVQELFEQRASLVQDYDVGEAGRFDSQRRAFVMALENPLGIGPEQWAMINKLDTHNVYLNVLVAGGVLSALGFVAFLAMTFVAGKRAIFANGPGQEFLIVAYACLVGHMVEAFIIDVDNWRHLFLLFGMAWGAILATKAMKAAPARSATREPPVLASGFTG